MLRTPQHNNNKKNQKGTNLQGKTQKNTHGPYHPSIMWLTSNVCTIYNYNATNKQCTYNLQLQCN